jgi:hypothetical protein
MATTKGKVLDRAKCEVCGSTQRLSLARCTCGATLTLCEECYGERESVEGGGSVEECPACAPEGA